MIDKIDITQMQDVVGKTSSRQDKSAGSIKDNDQDASLQVNYASLINEAMQKAQTDTEAVQRAKELISSGKLETLENTRQASESIINFGI